MYNNWNSGNIRKLKKVLRKKKISKYREINTRIWYYHRRSQIQTDMDFLNYFFGKDVHYTSGYKRVYRQKGIHKVMMCRCPRYNLISNRTSKFITSFSQIELKPLNFIKEFYDIYNQIQEKSYVFEKRRFPYSFTSRFKPKPEKTKHILRSAEEYIAFYSTSF